jgi:TolB-like protein/tetratricopeptide (TPR) repeat protein/tRNA A-37 threonylcarbamoyl transferase component Bud32
MIGRQISHFYIIRALGGGGMGVVYEAQDTRLPRSVAIKLLNPAIAKDVDAVRRFKREARLACSLNHPNICAILDVDEGDGQAFIAMELLHGRSLKARLSAEPLPLDDILHIAGQVADALAAAHDQGIIHRDVTPGNVFLTGGGLVKLLDFGLARHVPAADGDAGTTDDLTATGAVVGTVHYMAPELLADDAPVDHRCDLYSLGAVLYEMATGARPFDLSSRNALISAIQHQPHVPVRQLAPEHPAELGRIIDRLLAKRPDDRCQSARALRAELDALRRATSSARVAATAPPGAPDGVTIAVLPFVIVGDVCPESATMRDGLAEDVSSRLSALPDVHVAPRTSTRARSGETAREIGERLGVALVLEGSLQRSDGRVRVTASLVDAAHERAVRPALTVERACGDVLRAQDEIAREICHGLSASLARAPERRHRRQAEALDAFKRGRHHWRWCFSGGWREAIEHFEYAIERDAELAPAHVALANAYNFLGFYSLMKPGLAFGVAARSAERAIAIDRSLAAAHVERALAKFGGDWDWDGSEEAFRQAIALDATNALAHVHYSWLLMVLHRHDAAFAEAQRGHDLAPSSRLVTTARAQTLFNGGRFAEAIALCDACLRADPEYAFAVQLRGQCHLALAQRDLALADLERAAELTRRLPYYLGLLGLCYGRFGMRDQALALIDELGSQARDGYVPPQSYVFIYAGLGEGERALAHQERAYEDGASPFNYLTPSIRDLYALDPYHSQRLKQMRLVV